MGAMHVSSQCPICRGNPTEGSMSDAEFAEFLAECRQELAELQAKFQLRMERGVEWFYDLSDCTLKIGNQMFAITPIGTFSPEYQTWLWAWANDDFPSRAREASKRIQALHATTGFQVFLDPRIRASASDAEDFAALANHILGSIGLFRVPLSHGPTFFLAVHRGSRFFGFLRRSIARLTAAPPLPNSKSAAHPPA